MHHPLRGLRHVHGRLSRERSAVGPSTPLVCHNRGLVSNDQNCLRHFLLLLEKLIGGGNVGFGLHELRFNIGGVSDDLLPNFLLALLLGGLLRVDLGVAHLFLVGDRLEERRVAVPVELSHHVALLFLFGLDEELFLGLFLFLDSGIIQILDLLLHVLHIYFSRFFFELLFGFGLHGGFLGLALCCLPRTLR